MLIFHCLDGIGVIMFGMNLDMLDLRLLNLLPMDLLPQEQ